MPCIAVVAQVYLFTTQACYACHHLGFITVGLCVRNMTAHLCVCVCACTPAVCTVGVTLNCEKLVKMLTALQRRQQHRAGVLGAAGGGGGHGGGGGLTGLLLEGGGRQPGSQCDVLVCARGGDGRLQVRCPVAVNMCCVRSTNGYDTSTAQSSAQALLPCRLIVEAPTSADPQAQSTHTYTQSTIVPS